MLWRSTLGLDQVLHGYQLAEAPSSAAWDLPETAVPSSALEPAPQGSQFPFLPFRALSDHLSPGSAQGVPQMIQRAPTIRLS